MRKRFVCSDDSHSVMWFIGLELNKQQIVTNNIDLTHDIQVRKDGFWKRHKLTYLLCLQYFTDTVVRQATYANQFKEGMRVICQYVRKKELPKV